MCPPAFFDVAYAINPWMDPAAGVDRERALAQWTALVDAYRTAGHRVDLLAPAPGSPDMVFAANGATVVDGRVLQARFAYPQRAAEAEVHAEWHRTHPVVPGAASRARPRRARAVNEGEGDFAVLANRVLAGYGFRTALAAHRELAALTGREVLSLELVDPRFYHLDVALAVLDDTTDHLAYYPPAFSPASQGLLRRLFPDALQVEAADAYAFGLNAVSDGRRVFLPAGADGFAASLAAAGYEPRPLDLSELRMGGGAVKCCTAEIRAPRSTRPSNRLVDVQEET